jgi:hypothetical protein
VDGGNHSLPLKPEAALRLQFIRFCRKELISIRRAILEALWQNDR